MIKKIFTYIFSAVLVAVLLEGVLVSVILYSSLNKRTAKTLDADTYAVSRVMNTKLSAPSTANGTLTSNGTFTANDDQSTETLETGITYLSVLDNSRSDRRFTWIASDGTVLYDTVKAPLENHLNRPEIQAALKSGVGRASRFSDTMAEKTLYTALKLDNGTVLRLAQTRQSVFLIMMSGLQPFLTGLFILMIFSAVLAVVMAKKIIKPINELNLDNPELNKLAGYEELEPLLFRLIKQKAEIRDTMEKLQCRQKEFENITSGMNEGIVLLNIKLNILSLNQSALDIFAVKNEDCVGRTALTLNRSDAFMALIQTVTNGNLPAECEISKNGSWYKVTANSVYTGDSRTGTVLFVTDITASRNAEQTRRDFTANVSHELKTPLTSISGYAEIIRDGIAAPEDISDFASRICAESKRLLNLVEDIIKLSHLDEMTSQSKSISTESVNTSSVGQNGIASLTNGTTEDAFVAVNLSEVVTDVSSRLELEATKKKVKLQVSLPAKPCVIAGNEIILEELVYNLCDNAIKYNKENGLVKVTVTSDEATGNSNSSAGITLTVSDTGIGIPNNEREKVFERFYRVDKSRSKQTGGTGLGLAIVKHAAQYHNAKIQLESELGEGTTVTVKF